MLNCHSESFSIAVDGKWGDGKTFFVKQCQLVLDYLNDKDLQDNNKQTVLQKIGNGKEGCLKKIKYKTVYFDAWKSDSELDPIVSLSEGIASADSKFLTLVKDVGKTPQAKLVEIALKIAIEKLTKLSIDEIIDQIKSNSDDEAKFKAELTKLVPENGRLAIFIDELDRCRPTYAVKLLERIQHFFENENITFVFSVNQLELENTLKRLYGTNFDSNRYLDRFFNIVIPIPPADLNMYYRKIDGLPTDNRYPYSQYYKQVVNFFGLSLREINHFYSRIDIAESKLKNKTGFSSLFSNEGNFLVELFIVPYLMALKMINSEEYNKTISGQDSSFLVDFLSSNKTFSSYTQTNELDGLKKAAEKIYDVIFKNNESLEQVAITSKIIIERPDKLKEYVSDIISLISDYSTYESD